MRSFTTSSSRLLPLFAACALAFAPACSARRGAETSPPPEASSEAAPQLDEDLVERLTRLERELERQRVEHHVPGMAAAVVKDGEVIWAKGFGHADVEGEIPVTTETMFAIGSTTKAFTSTLIGTLVDEGRMDWDDQVVRHLPELRLRIEGDSDAQATVRDLLCHRTGFPRMSLLWVSGALPREDILARAATAEPIAPFRSKFLYNNVMYAAAGEASARAARTAWEDLLQTRLLEPVGMRDTVISADPDVTPNLARGYEWRDVEKTLRRVPKRDIASVGPAGAIDSTVLDMAKWVRLLLGRGEIEGRRIVSAEAIEETWKPHIEVAPSVEYGLGWMLRTWEGRRVVEHGGNIDGFAAEVALMPDEQLGFILLTNISSTPLQSAAPEMVWRALLGEPEDANAPVEDLRPFLGKYVADFGPFQDARFTVTESGGKLFVDVPGQTNFEVRPPGKDGRRPFALTDTIAISFERDGGDVVMMRMHQSGLDFELPREGWIPAPELPLEELQRYVGTYRGDPFGEVPVLVRNNRLAVDVPKQMVYELHAPDDQGRWRFRVKQDIAVSFESKGDRITGMKLYQDGNEVVFERTGGARATPTVDLARIDRVRRSARTEAALAKVGVLVGRGKVRLPQSGVEGTAIIVAAADGRATIEMDFGELGQIHDVLLEDTAWTKASFAPVDLHTGKYLDQARHGHPLALFGDWSRRFSEASVLGEVERDKRTLWRVRLGRGDAPPVEVLVDSKTGDPIETRGLKILRLGGGIPVTSRYTDFRRVLGMRLPHQIETEDEPSGRVVITIDRWARFTDDLAATIPASPPE